MGKPTHGMGINVSEIRLIWELNLICCMLLVKIEYNTVSHYFRHCLIISFKSGLHFNTLGNKCIHIDMMIQNTHVDMDHFCTDLDI